MLDPSLLMLISTFLRVVRMISSLAIKAFSASLRVERVGVFESITSVRDGEGSKIHVLLVW
jgi:hypothetical protein